MASPIVVTLGDITARFNHKKLDRSALYGKRQRIFLDPEDNVCQRAKLSDDGAVLIRTGMLAQAYFDEEGNWVPSKDLVGIDAEGNVLEKSPSTLGQPQALRGPVPPEEVLDFQVSSLYLLDPLELDETLESKLKAGDIFSFDFNYRADYNPQRAFLLANDEGYFALIGDVIEPVWLDLEQVVTQPVELEEDDDDLDFEMF